MPEDFDIVDYVVRRSAPKQFSPGGNVVSDYEDTINVSDVLNTRGVQAAKLAQAQANAQNALKNQWYGGWLPEVGYHTSVGDLWETLAPEPGTMGNAQSLFIMENIIQEALEGMQSTTAWDSDEITAFQNRIYDNLVKAAEDAPDNEQLQTIATDINMLRGDNIPHYYGDLSKIKDDRWAHSSIYLRENPNTFNDDDLTELYGLSLEKLKEWREKEHSTQPGGNDPYFQELGERKDYVQSVRDTINSRGLDMPTGTFTQNVSAIGRTVGGWFDKIFEFLDISGPDYAVGQWEGGTLIWGTPQGDAVFSRIGTTPEGTIVGIQTGIPTLDRILSHVADVMTGRVELGEVFNADTVAQLVLDAVGDELGLEPGFMTVEGLDEAIANIKTKLEGTNEDGSAVTMAQAVDNTIFDEDKTTNYDGTPTDAETQTKVLSTPGGTQLGVGTTAAGVLVAAAARSGDSSGDVISTAGGQEGDTVTTTGATGVDTVVGGTGTSTVVGGTGADTTVGGTGTSTVVGGTGADTTVGGTGTSTVVGATGADTTVGGTGTSTVVGGTGADTTVGGTGTSTVVGALADITLGGKLNEIVLGGDPSEKVQVGGEETGIDVGGGISGDWLGGGISGDQLGGALSLAATGGEQAGIDIGGATSDDRVGANIFSQHLGANVSGLGAGGEQAGIDIGGATSDDRVGANILAQHLGANVSGLGIGGEKAGIDVGGATPPSGDRVGANILGVDVGGRDRALSFGGEKVDVNVGGGRDEITVGDEIYNLLAGNGERTLDVGGDRLLTGGDRTLDVGDEIYTDLQTPGGDKTLTIGGGDKTLDVGGGGGGGGGLGLGDSGFRGYKDEPGDLVGDFPLVSPYGAYTMEEMMAALDAIIGATEDSEKD